MTEQDKPKSGRYEDRAGNVWSCFAKDGRMICDSITGYTVADYETFRRWGWTPHQPKGPTT